MLRQGTFKAAGARFRADYVTSYEPAGGIMGNAWAGSSRIDNLGIDGPFVTGDQFALFLDMLIVDRASGAATPFAEIAVFTVRDAKITEERYFYD